MKRFLLPLCLAGLLLVALMAQADAALQTLPSSLTVRPGQEAVFTVQSDAYTTYQWQTRLSPEGEWQNTGLNGNRTDTLRFTPTIAYDGRQYRCVLTGVNGSRYVTSAATLVMDIVRLTGQPAAQTVGVGATATFQVSATGEGLTYQWQTKLTPESAWANTGLSGNKTDTLTFSAGVGYDGRQYRCIVRDQYGAEAVSTAALLTVTQARITAQPASVTVPVRGTATFHVTAEGEGLTYQWQTKLTPESVWANTGLSGNKTDTLSFPVGAGYDGRQYRCVVRDSNGGTATSAAATLTLSRLAFITQPVDCTVGVNGSVRFYAAAEGNGLGYQWQTKLTPESAWANTGLDGNQTDTLTFTAGAGYNGRQYRCVVRDSTGNTVTSAAATLTVRALTLTKEPEDVLAEAGEVISLHVAAEGDGLTYQWQTKLTPASSWLNTGLIGCKTDTLTLTALASYNGRAYRCVVQDGYGNRVVSRAAALTIAPLAVAVTPALLAVHPGESLRLAAATTLTGLTYQWQTKLTPESAWADTGLDGNKTSALTFTPGAAYDGRQYRCVVSDRWGNRGESDAVTLRLLRPEITAQPDDLTLTAGEEAQFHILATGEGLTCQWQTKLTPESAWANTGLGGNDTDTLTFIPGDAYSGRQYRCVVTDSYGMQAISEAATLTVLPAPAEPVPAAPTGLQAALSGDGIAVEWDTVAGATGYRVWAGTASAWQEDMALQAVEATLDATQSTFLQELPLRVGETWHVWVAAVNASGEGARSVRYDVRVLLQPPAEVRAVALETTAAEVTWAPVAGAEAYLICWGTTAVWNSGLPSLRVEAGANATRVDGLEPGKSYYFWAIACAEGQESDLPAYSRMAALKALTAPTGLAISTTSEGLTVTWSPVEGAAGYVVYTHTASTFDAAAAAAHPASEPTLTLPAPDAGEAVYIWVAAVDENGAGKRAGWKKAVGE